MMSFCVTWCYWLDQHISFISLYLWKSLFSHHFFFFFLSYFSRSFSFSCFFPWELFSSCISFPVRLLLGTWLSECSYLGKLITNLLSDRMKERLVLSRKNSYHHDVNSWLWNHWLQKAIPCFPLAGWQPWLYGFWKGDKRSEILQHWQHCGLRQPWKSI